MINPEQTKDPKNYEFARQMLEAYRERQAAQKNVKTFMSKDICNCTPEQELTTCTHFGA